MDEFDWDADNLQHIAEHNVTREEVEYVLYHHTCELEYQDWHEAEERFQEVGVTAAGRFLIVLTTFRGYRLRVVTAFDAPGFAIREYLKSR